MVSSTSDGEPEMNKLSSLLVVSVFKSDDGGAGWQPADPGLPDAFVSDIAIDPVQPTTLYAATDRFGVFRSTDSGKSWQSLNAGTAGGGGGVVSLLRR
jgi:photosystem II stability/assembly factor-like uncharacterized protein